MLLKFSEYVFSQTTFFINYIYNYNGNGENNALSNQIELQVNEMLILKTMKAYIGKMAKRSWGVEALKNIKHSIMQITKTCKDAYFNGLTLYDFCHEIIFNVSDVKDITDICVR